MLARSLCFSNKFFASKFILLKQGFFIPTPPVKPQTERIILLDLVKKNNHLEVKNKISALKDQKFAVEERQQAKILREQQLKDYEKQKQEYKKSFDYPKRHSSPFAIFLKDNFNSIPNAKMPEVLKQLSEKFKKLTPSEREIYDQKSKVDSERVKQEIHAFEERNAQLKVPSILKLNGYSLYVKQQFALNPKVTFSVISKQWKSVSEEEKKVLNEQAEGIKKEQMNVLHEFQQKNNIPDEDLKQIFQRKTKESE